MTPACWTKIHPKSGVNEYLLSLLKVQMLDPEPYLFDKDCIVLPAYLKQTLPGDIVQGFIHARWAASKALRSIRAIEKNYHKRYFTMCPLIEPARVLAHIEPVSRLLAWKSDHNHTNPTLAPTAKLDPTTLKFHVDQRTYDEFARGYVALLERFIEEPYKRWLEAKREVDARVRKANLSEMEYGRWHRFWDLTFLAEMNKWEGRLEGLLLPSWEEAMDSLYGLILEFVESPQDVLMDLSVGSGLMTQ